MSPAVATQRGGGHGALGLSPTGAILRVQVVTGENTAHLCGPGQVGPSCPPTVSLRSHGCPECLGGGQLGAHGVPARGHCTVSLLHGGLCVVCTLNYSVSLDSLSSSI